MNIIDDIKKVTYLLALANTPSTGKSILNWIPFPLNEGNELGEIIDAENNRWVQYCKTLGWLTEDIKNLGEKIQVFPSDLSDINKVEDFAQIYLLLINLDDIKGQDLDSLFEPLKSRMLRHIHKYCIAQTSIKPQPVSCLPKFKTIPFHPSCPEIITNQIDLENWLRIFHDIYESAVQHLSFSQSVPMLQVSYKLQQSLGVLPDLIAFTNGPKFDFDNNKVLRDSYFKAIPDLASRIRDSITSRGISSDATSENIKELAYQEASKEIARIYLRQSIETPEITKVIMGEIFEPLEEIKSEFTSCSEWEYPTLIEVCLSDRVRRMTLGQLKSELQKEQFPVLRNLGIKNRNCSALLWNHPITWNRLDAVENLVEIHERSASLPMKSILGHQCF